MIRARGVVLGGVAAAVVVAVGALAWVAVRPGQPGSPLGAPASTPVSPSPSAGPTSPTALGHAFLDNWVTDGRVIRKDQGGDTVSEGQAYGMLIAVGVGDKSSFDSIWGWTKQHMMRTDGLLAWRWNDGAVVDDEPAADADLDTARALVLAGDRFDRPSLTKAGDALGERILDRMTAQTNAGRILLPGMWAATNSPYSYNPSYASPVAYSVLAKSSSDPRWSQLQKGSTAVTTALLDKSPLPPDWAQVHADNDAVDALPGPTGNGPTVQYSFDAARLPVRFAESCSATDRALAAKLGSTLGQRSPLDATLDLGGGSLGQATSPVSYGGRAAAYAAAGDDGAAKTDLTAAAKLAATTPTYYGAAWAALAPLMLETTTLGGCPPLKETN